MRPKMRTSSALRAHCGAKNMPDPQNNDLNRGYICRCDAEHSAIMTGATDNQWWAMSATYNRSLILKKQLDQREIHNFVPVRHSVIVKGTRKVKKTMPAVANLIFIYSSQEKIKALKAEYSYLQYLIKKADGKSMPIIVPEDQMRDFITVANSTDDNPTYLSPSEIDLTKGERVKIIAGPFAGVTGIFKRIKGSRDRRVIVAIEGITAVAATSIPLAFIEKA